MQPLQSEENVGIFTKAVLVTLFQSSEHDRLTLCLLCYLFFQSKSSLEMMESQSCDAEPPPPPKPELRYPGMTRGNAEGNVFYPSAPSLTLTNHPHTVSQLLVKAKD